MKKIKILSVIVVLFLVNSNLSCFDQGDGNAEIEDYENFKTGCTFLQQNVENNLSMNAIACVELEGNGTTPYRLEYSMDRADILVFNSEGSFCLNSIELIGSPCNRIWKFDPVKNSSVTITFKSCHVAPEEGCIGDSINYNVTVEE